MKFTGEFFVPDDKFKQLKEDRENAIEHLQRYRSVVQIVAGKSVLDIASGEGYGAAILAETADKVIGVDINPELVQHATIKYARHNLSFRTGDVSSIPLENESVDVVISFETMEHIEQNKQQLFIEEISRILTKDGVLVISTPDRRNYSERFNFTNAFHVHELDEADFTSLLERFFPKVHVFKQGQEVTNLVFRKEKYEHKATVNVLPIVQDHYRFEGKYLLAVCGKSGKAVLPDISSVVIEGNKSYFDLTDRIVRLQDEVEELGTWGKRSAGEVEELRVALDERNKSLELTERTSRDQDSIIKQYEVLVTSRELLYRESTSVVQGKDELLLEYKKLLDEKENIVNNIQAAANDQNSRISELRLEIDRQRNLLETLSQSNAVLSADKRELETDRADLQLRLDNARLECDGLIQAKRSLLTESADLKQRLMTLEREWQESAAALKAADETVVDLRAEIRDTVSKNAETAMRKEEEIGTLSTKVSELSCQIEEQKNTIYGLKSQKLTLEQRMQDIYDSEGYKILSIYYRMKGRMLPEHTRRYKTLKKWFSVFKKKQRPLLASGAIQPEKVPVPALPFSEPGFPVYFPQFGNVVVSIVIPAYNNWQFTKNCLLSIYAYNDNVPFEVIIGDNVSTDETIKLPEYFKNVRYIRNPENLGYIRNVNNAASKARGKYILTLNNDTTVTEGWLSHLVEIMESDPKVGLVGSKLVFPDGSLQEAGGIIWDDASGWNYGRGGDPDLPEYNYVKEVDYISGASNLIRRELWEMLGGLDLRYVPAYFDDSDLAFGIRKLGYKVVYQPLSVVVHYEGLTHGTSTSGGTKQYQRLNLAKFKEKWESELRSFQFPNAENVFWARDRSRNKKTIVVIDHYVPHFDKDAGSRTVFQYLKLFVALNYNVKFIGDNFFRHEPYTSVLQQMGIEVLYGPWYFNNWQRWIIDNKECVDYVLLNRPHISIKYVDFLRDNVSAKILYYGHDLHFNRLQKQYEVEKKEELLAAAEEWKRTEMSLFEKSDVILTPSQDECDLIKGLGVQNLVKAIKPYIFDRAPISAINFADRKDILFIGGFTHVPNVDAVIWFVKQVWPLAKSRLGNARFIVAGSNVPPEVALLGSSDIEIKGFIPDEALSELYGKIRIVVVPLRYGAGVKGKTVEALYHGIPVVSTEFGTEGLPGDISFLKPIASAGEFAEELVRLYNAPDEQLARYSKLETEYIERNFSVKAVREEMMELMAEIG